MHIIRNVLEIRMSRDQCLKTWLRILDVYQGIVFYCLKFFLFYFKIFLKFEQKNNMIKAFLRKINLTH